MKRSAIAAIACLVASTLTGCVTVDPATLRPIYADRARPYINAALTTPMDMLYAKALAGNAYDQLTYGLALAAGRPSSATVSSDDATRLQMLDARFQAAAQAWRAEHRDGDPAKVDWRKRVALTDDDAALVRRVEEATSADYWLSRAANANTSSMMFIYMPATTKGGAGYTMPITTYDPVIPYDVVFTAGDCAVALRTGAGFAKPEPVPDVVRRLRDPGINDYQSLFVLDGLQNVPNRRHFTGTDACGGAAAYETDLNLLLHPPAAASDMGRTL